MGREEIKELQVIKKLLMLELIKSGATLEELKMATGLDASQISRMLPIRKIKK